MELWISAVYILIQATYLNVALLPYFVKYLQLSAKYTDLHDNSYVLVNAVVGIDSDSDYLFVRTW